MPEKTYLPQFFPFHWEADYQVFGIRFTHDVSLGFVCRGAGEYSYLLTDEREALQGDDASLIEDACSNLTGLAPIQICMARPPGATLIWVNAEDNFIAVRMLLTDVLSIIREEVGGEFLFTIPSRDNFLAWNLDAPLDTTLGNAAQAKSDFEVDDYRLSPCTFRFRDVWPCDIAGLPT